MSKHVLKLTVVVSAILLFAVNAEAGEMTSGAEFELQTGKVGEHVIGKTTDNQFFAISCKPHWGANRSKGLYTYYSAKMAFPNEAGQILFKIKNATGEVLLFNTLPLTQVAADKLCVETEGVYSVRIVGENDQQAVDLVNRIKDAPSRVELRVGTTLQLRTALVGNTIVAATSEGNYFGIMCDYGYGAGIVHTSYANFVYPNYLGKIVAVPGYDSKIFGPKPIAESAAYLPMSDSAMSQICNFPNKMYTLRISGSDKAKVVDIDGRQTFEANTREGGRGF